MTTTTEVPQHLGALRRANRIRLDRAALKRRVAAGDVDLADLIRPDAEIPGCLGSAPIGQVLAYQHRWGSARARRLLLSVGIGEKRRLDALTRRERGRITALLLGTEPQELSAAA